MPGRHGPRRSHSVPGTATPSGPSGSRLFTTLLLEFSIVDVSRQIGAAVAAARKAQVAIVFAGDFSTEGADQPNLVLSDDSNALISAVASANPNTIVVLNTGGAVLMPWLDKVAGVLEAWYPGEEDGNAIEAVLTGGVDPAGRLPITFPASESAQPVSQSSQFPGVDSVVSYGSGLDVGYRWYQANNVRPLFPFGFGLDYTNFNLSKPTVQETASGFVVHVTVHNTGSRSGSDVVQAYVHDAATTESRQNNYEPSPGSPFGRQVPMSSA